MIIDELKELIIQYEDEGEIGVNAYTDLIFKLEQLRPLLKTEGDNPIAVEKIESLITTIKQLLEVTL